MDEYQIKAYAKINLGLDVIGRLPNGYHQVKMIMQSIGLWDRLTFQKAENDIIVTTDSDLLPTDENNLIYKAAKLMKDKYGLPSGIRIQLEKHIPIAAGLAGGSTDAAATMKGINRLFHLNVSLAQLMEDGLSIGADVPYCLLGGTALAEGIGEKLTPLPPAPDCYVLVAKPDIMVSTKYVYEHLDTVAGVSLSAPNPANRRSPVSDTLFHPDIDGMTEAIREGSLSGILCRMGNVLESVTIPAYPVVSAIKNRMLELGAAGSLMCGSGPTVFGIFPIEEQKRANAALEQLRLDGLAKQIFLVTLQTSA